MKGMRLSISAPDQRYVVSELSSGWNFKPLQGRHGATLFAVALAALMAAVPPPGQQWSMANAGQGGLILWPLFGATNQLLGGLSFLVITFYLWRRNRPIWFLTLPMIFMLLMPMWAMVWQLFIGGADSPSWINQGKWTLVAIGLATIILEIWMVIEAVLMFPQAKGILESNALDSSAMEGTASSVP